MSILYVRELYKSFGDKAILQGVNAEFICGINLIIGPNGIGKSTLLKVLSGIYYYDKGEIFAKEDGKTINYNKLIKETFYVPDSLYPSWFEYKVKEFIEIISKLTRKNLIEKVNIFLEELKLDASILDNKMGSLSSGLKRKILILISCLVSEWKSILLYDEPFANLDPKSLRIVARLINKLSKDKIVIVSTHILDRDIIDILLSNTGQYTLSTLVDGKLKHVTKDLLLRIIDSKVIEVPCKYLEKMKAFASEFIVIRDGEICRILVKEENISSALSLIGDYMTQLRSITIDDIYRLLIK